MFMIRNVLFNSLKKFCLPALPPIADRFFCLLKFVFADQILQPTFCLGLGDTEQTAVPGMA
jgi:hypothetical protein